MASLLSLVLLLISAFHVTITVAASCNSDNCARAVTGTYRGLDRVSLARRDCSSFLMQTSTIPQTYTVSTSTTTSVTSGQPDGNGWDWWHGHGHWYEKRQWRGQNERISGPPWESSFHGADQGIPDYASACSGTASYSSACSCFGVAASTSTSAIQTVTIVKTTTVIETYTTPSAIFSNSSTSSPVSNATTISNRESSVEIDPQQSTGTISTRASQTMILSTLSGSGNSNGSLSTIIPLTFLNSTLYESGTSLLGTQSSFRTTGKGTSVTPLTSSIGGLGTNSLQTGRAASVSNISSSTTSISNSTFTWTTLPLTLTNGVSHTSANTSVSILQNITSTYFNSTETIPAGPQSSLTNLTANGITTSMPRIGVSTTASNASSTMTAFNLTSLPKPSNPSISNATALTNPTSRVAASSLLNTTTSTINGTILRTSTSLGLENITSDTSILVPTSVSGTTTASHKNTTTTPFNSTSLSAVLTTTSQASITSNETASAPTSNPVNGSAPSQRTSSTSSNPTGSPTLILNLTSSSIIASTYPSSVPSTGSNVPFSNVTVTLPSIASTLSRTSSSGSSESSTAAISTSTPSLSCVSDAQIFSSTFLLRDPSTGIPIMNDNGIATSARNSSSSDGHYSFRRADVLVDFFDVVFTNADGTTAFFAVTIAGGVRFVAIRQATQFLKAMMVVLTLISSNNATNFVQTDEISEPLITTIWTVQCDGTVNAGIYGGPQIHFNLEDEVVSASFVPPSLGKRQLGSLEAAAVGLDVNLDINLDDSKLSKRQLDVETGLLTGLLIVIASGGDGQTFNKRQIATNN